MHWRWKDQDLHIVQWTSLLYSAFKIPTATKRLNQNPLIASKVLSWQPSNWYLPLKAVRNMSPSVPHQTDFHRPESLLLCFHHNILCNNAKLMKILGEKKCFQVKHRKFKGGQRGRRRENRPFFWFNSKVFWSATTWWLLSIYSLFAPKCLADKLYVKV